MPSERLELIIDAMNYANAELDELKRDLEGVDTAGKKGKTGLDQFKAGWQEFAAVGATVVAAGLAAKKAWDFTKEGAQIELTASQYKNVAEDAGYAADALLGKMRAATSGMVKDSVLMASGLDIIRLGLADNEQGIVDLANAVSTLGLDMQQVIMTFSNDSVMRLDALGLSVEKVQNRVKELKEEGFVGDAFDEAVLEGLLENMDILGDKSDTVAGKMAMVETRLGNIKDLAATGAALKAFDLFTEVDAWNALNDAYDRGAISAFDLWKAKMQLFYGIQIGKAAIDNYNLSVAAMKENLAMMTNEAADADIILAQYTTTQREAADVTLENYRAYGQAASAVDFYRMRAEEAARQSNVAGHAIRDNAAEALDSTSSWATLNGELTIAGQAYSDISTNVSGASQAIQDQIDFLTGGGGVITAMIAAAKDAINQGDFGLAQKISDDIAIADVDMRLESGDIDATEAAAELVEQLDITPERAQEIVQSLEDTLFEVTSRTYLLKFDIEVTGQIPIVRHGGSQGGSKDNEDEFASGTGGWLTVPGAPSEPRSITVHGGESMNVVPAGQAIGGGTPQMTVIEQNFYGDFIVPNAGEAVALFERFSENARREAANMRAGAAYTG